MASPKPQQSKPVKFATWRKNNPGPYWPKSAIIVGVHWIDAVKVETDEGDAHPVDAFTVGVVVEADSKHIAITPEIFNDGTFRDRTGIPTGMIKGVSTMACVNMT